MKNTMPSRDAPPPRDAATEDRIPPVLIYRDQLLGPSEGFVLAQGEAFRRFRAFYAGSKRVAGGETPPARTFLVNRGGRRGRLAELMFKMGGWEPNLYRWAESMRPALMHAHFGPDGGLVLGLARKLGIPLVVTFHGFDVTMKDDYARRSFYLHRKYLQRREELQQHGAAFVAVSEFIRDKLVAQGFPAERTFVRYIGVDTKRFRENTAVERMPIALFVGRLSPEKGCDYLIRAMAQVQAARRTCELVVIGDGPERDGLETLARQLRVRARFLGRQPQDVVQAALTRASVFCAPSVTVDCGESEGFGLSALEAQATGTPVAGFATGGLREAVVHGVTGLLAPEGDQARLAEHILTLLNDPDLARRLGKAGRARTVREFDLARQTTLLEDLYSTVLAGRSEGELAA